MYTDDLPWVHAHPFAKRCKGRITYPEATTYYGRCELRPHSDQIEHALERGMVIVRWKDSPVRLEQPSYRPILCNCSGPHSTSSDEDHDDDCPAIS